MKAKEIFEQHREGFISGDPVETARGVLKQFLDEMAELYASRRVTKTVSSIAIVRELNQKWNALARIMAREGCPYLLKDDAFTDYVVEEMRSKFDIDLGRYGAVK